MGGKGSGSARAGGRPPLRGATAKEVIQIRVTAEDKQKILQGARDSDVSLSQFVLETSLKHALYLWTLKR